MFQLVGCGSVVLGGTVFGVVALASGQVWQSLLAFTPLACLLLLMLDGSAAVRRRRDRVKKCRHGVKGAFREPARCETCVAEARDEAARAMAVKAAAAAREALKRQPDKQKKSVVDRLSTSST